MLTFILMLAYPCQDSVTESQPLMFAWCTGGSVNGSETIDGRRTGRGSLRGTSSRTKSLLSRLCDAGEPLQIKASESKLRVIISFIQAQNCLVSDNGKIRVSGGPFIQHF